MTKNKFCDEKNLRNESDVEQFFLLPLLKELGYTENYIKTKATIKEASIGKGRERRRYSPDYICYADKKHLKPVLIIDAKHPSGDAREGVRDSQLYTSVIRRKLREPKPIQYCMGSNGKLTIVNYFEKDEAEFEVRFSEFQDYNKKFKLFKKRMSRENLTHAVKSTFEPFKFRKPSITEMTGIFEVCHDTIRRKEGMGPEPAFYEFSKMMFVKLKKDKELRSISEIRELIESGSPLPQEKIVFSLNWIQMNEASEPNPIDAILFRRLRDELEFEIINKKKKRIFEKDEQIDLKPETIKEIVRLLEHLDLFGIDEDLNGRLFETFLSATMRGEDLGQYFTPRTVVEFMTKIADLRADRERIDFVLDACCGTGGFLIEAMADMGEKIKKNRALDGAEKEKMLEKVRDTCILGIDFGKKPPMARIARINMYLHGGGGSRIYFADALDKKVFVAKGSSPEVQSEREELKDILLKKNLKFDVVLTNPPFSMYYKKKELDDRAVLEQYDLAWKGNGRLRASLGSNVMFLERYKELLKPGGKLIIVIDESILNTDTQRYVRGFTLDNFLVKAVISLPRGTFKRAGANVKTSILYLVKKERKSDAQPHTFYARSKNTGFDPNNTKKLDTSKSDLGIILKKFKDFQKKGKL